VCRLTTLTQLTFLSLQHCLILTDATASVGSVAQISSLEHPDLSGHNLKLSRAALAQLRALPVLRHLEVTVWPDCAQSLLALLDTSLKRLTIRPANIGRHTSASAAARPSLESAFGTLRASGIAVTCGHVRFRSWFGAECSM
jgi:hypothetical protein